MEIEVAKRADFVFTITQAIADILIEYGIESRKDTGSAKLRRYRRVQSYEKGDS